MPHPPSVPYVLAPGAVIANRFTLQSQAGQGGMGFVYRALDANSGHVVALKLMHAAANATGTQRFLREARVLSELQHPGIVSYVAHGVTEDGQPFLAMEWLEGEDLARCLASRPLALADTLRLARRVAEGLAYAHERGVIHRDIKPSNLFLRGGDAQDAVLLDFGLARVVAASQALTGSAMVLGTPGYMAPEQASHQEDISPSADIFSLGCVLYECLTGHQPFRAPHMAAVLAKLLFTEPPSVNTFRPELPASWEILMDRMLAKNPAQRIPDARHLLRALDELEQGLEVSSAAATVSVSTPVLPKVEQQLVSALLATPMPFGGDAPTLEPGAMTQQRQRLESLRQELEQRGAKAALLPDCSILATFLLERGTALEHAALAAHCALSIKEQWPESVVVLTTGLSLHGKPLPAGEAVDRAGGMLRMLENEHVAARAHVLLDETTAGLLNPRFQFNKTPSGVYELRGEQLNADASRPLLGRPTPCVGREQELALLEMACTACIEDSSARALLVTAAAGMGKSRLRHEFVRRLTQRAPSVLVLLGRGDPMNAGSAYGLLGQALRNLCGVVDGEPLKDRRQKLAQRVSRHLPPGEIKDTVDFLGELCGVAFPSEDSPKLLAARDSPQMMSRLVAQAMVVFLRAELAQHPVLLLMEDLHWCDAPSVRLVDELLRELAEFPFLVLGLARPDVKDLYPGLWSHCLQELPLRGLSQKASLRLIYEVLGTDLPQEVVARLVEQAAGNALFLEELIRGVAEGRGGETPGTVLAMLQSRLQRLEPSARRVLLAGSIFGRAFWAGGCEALLNEGSSAEELEHGLRQLIAQEVVQPQPGSRFPADSEYRFRHALVRDAAYGLVPDSLKSAWHCRAGGWLESAGEPDALVLAEHYQLGQEKRKAAFFFTRAGERLFERHDLLGAQRYLEAALACAPTGKELVGIQALQTAIILWMEDFAQSYVVSSEILPLPAQGSMFWVRMMGSLLLVCAQNGRQVSLAELGPRVLASPPDPQSVTGYVETASALACMTTWFGQRHEAVAILARLDPARPLVAERDRITQGWMSCAQGYFDHFFEARPWRGRVLAEEANRGLPEATEHGLAALRNLRGLTLAAVGDLPGAIGAMREGLASTQRARQPYGSTYLRVHLALVLAGSAEQEHQREAREIALELLKAGGVNLLHMGLAYVVSSKVLAAQGALSDAEAEARRACELLAAFVPYQLLARETLCSVLLSLGRAGEARAEAETAVRMLERMGSCGAASVAVWVAMTEACLAQGDVKAGEGALMEALRCLRLRAEDLPAEQPREHFLHRVPENARALELARQQWGMSESSLLA